MTESKLNNLFFALWPDRSVMAELACLQHAISGQAERMQHPQDLHMTLVFLGKVAPERMDCIRQAAGSITAEPFTLELNKTGYWKRPRILWCSPDRIPGPLSRLVNDLQQALVACDFQPENRIYKPHVTLTRKASPVGAGTLGSAIIWRPREFVLAGSCSGPMLPRYRMINSWDIAG